MRLMGGQKSVKGKAHNTSHFFFYLPEKSYCMNQASESRTLRAFFYTFGIMLSQFAAVECNVLIQAGLGSLSRLCFLQHKGKLEQMLIPHLRNKGNGYKLSAQRFLGSWLGWTRVICNWLMVALDTIDQW